MSIKHHFNIPMKRFISNPIYFVVVISLLGFSFVSPLPQKELENHPPRWEKLGQKKVNYTVDRDEIYVTAREGRFTGIKLFVRKAPVNIHKFTVHFANGTTQNIAVRKIIPAGGQSRVLDIRGRRRVIKKVVFWYDTQGIQDRKGVVELWGRH